MCSSFHALPNAVPTAPFTFRSRLPSHNFSVNPSDSLLSSSNPHDSPLDAAAGSNGHSSSANAPAFQATFLNNEDQGPNLLLQHDNAIDCTTPSVSGTTDFPPPPIVQSLQDDIIRRWCAASQPSQFEEAGCAVCGLLKLKSDLSLLKHVQNMLHVLEVPGVTRVARKKASDPIRERSGPVIDNTCNMICNSCRSAVRTGKVPRFALCNGLWLGQVPPELNNLTFYERILVSRVRHSKCFVRVQRGGSNGNGHSKLVSNVIAFENPTPKIYDILPPPRKDIEEVLAIMFSGTGSPTDDDYKRALLLVRRNVVADAIHWCILNHCDYSDVLFSPDNLQGYAEDSPIVSIEFFEKHSNRNAEGVSVHDNLDDDGIEGGDCVFTVHGIVGEDLQHM
ncbi:hypothetical protein GG344DRAFT_46947, partial [Lentinula edodes]